MSPTAPTVPTAPVLGIIVCHNGENWLPLALSALRRSTIRPRHVLAVDTGSTDRTPELLAEAATPEAGAALVLDGVLTLREDAGFAGAVAEAVGRAKERWGDPGEWIWLLHDDCAPEPDCLDLLLRAADTAPSAAVLGPLAVEWSDPRLIVEAGLSTDASGHRRHTLPGGLRDAESPEQNTEVLAVPSAGSLVDREAWERLGGFDAELPLLREDLDFGWRVNAAGGVVLCVPLARLRHVRALATGRRGVHVARVNSVAAADRAFGLRTFLVNCSTTSFVLGLPRLVVLCVLRGLAFGLIRDGTRAGAEFAAVPYLVGGRAHLRATRVTRAGGRGSVRGLFTSRAARLRGAFAGGVVRLVRGSAERDAALGRLPEPTDGATAWTPPEARYSRPRPVGPDALPAGAFGGLGTRAAGLRRPGGIVAVPVPDGAVAEPTEPLDEPETSVRPSPGRAARTGGGLVFVEVDRRRILAATLLSPPVVLLVALTGLALLVHRSRLGLDLAGGSLLPVGDLDQVWSTYLSAWHPLAGGTASAAPVALPILGLLGALLAPVGGPAALVALVLIGHAPLAALVAYAATRRLRLGRWLRAGAAAAYALLPAATAAATAGRLGVVVAHILLPALLAGLVAVLTRADARWLSNAVLTALCLAVVGAFSPLAHGLALIGLAAGFVILPPVGTFARRLVAVAIVVSLPPLLLLPWLPALLTSPALLLHGLAGPADVDPLVADLVGLDPGGAGGLPLGIFLVVAAVVAVVVRPTPKALPGIAVAALGVGGVVLVRLVEAVPVRGGAAEAGYAGLPLLVVGAGLIGVVLAVCLPDRMARPVRLTRLGAVGGVALLLALAGGGIASGPDGPVRAGGGWRLAPSLTAELADTGRSVLVLSDGATPERQVGGRLPRFGDDAIAPVPGSSERLARWQRELLAGSASAVTSAAVAGVLFVVLPPGMEAAAGSPLRERAADLVAGAPPTSDGRTVLRLTPTSGRVTLVSPGQARRAVSGQAPAPEAMGGTAVVPVDAQLPGVRLRVSDGPTGRLLVLAAEEEPGWRATVNGRRVPIVPAWGHQVAVSVPERQSEVVVEFPGTLDNLMLLGQVAAVLFTVLTAIPGRRRAVQ